MTKWHLMIVGLLVVVAAVLVGMNWTSVGGTADRETETETAQVKAKTKKAPAESAETGSKLQGELQKRCEKLIAKHVGDEAEEEEIEEACACAAEEVNAEFEDELPDILKPGSADRETLGRVDEIVGECIESAGLELK